MFNTEHTKLGAVLTPTRQRRVKFLSMLKCFLSPVQVYQNEFEKNRKNNLYKLSHNGQICKLVSVLNDSFDKIQRRIYISDGGDIDVTLIHKDEDQKLLQLPVTIHRDDDYGDSGFDFVVTIPSGIAFNSEAAYHMRSIISYYKLAGKRYKINQV